MHGQCGLSERGACSVQWFSICSRRGSICGLRSITDFKFMSLPSPSPVLIKKGHTFHHLHDTKNDNDVSHPLTDSAWAADYFSILLILCYVLPIFVNASKIYQYNLKASKCCIALCWLMLPSPNKQGNNLEEVWCGKSNFRWLEGSLIKVRNYDIEIFKGLY